MSIVPGGMSISRAALLAGAAAIALKPLDAPYVLVDNSYGAQGGAIDVSQWTDMAMGARGLITLGTVQARGADRLSHAIDRIAPALSCCQNGVMVVMGPENDLADAAVTANSAGGDIMLGRLDTITASARAAGAKVVAFKQGNTNAAIGTKAAAAARYNAELAGHCDLAVDDPVDYQTFSSDKTHPNTAQLARALGEARGASIRSLYLAKRVFDDGGQIAGNFNPNWNMGGAAPTLTNNSGAAAAQGTDFLRSMPSVPCRKLTLTGTVTADPAGAGTTGDVVLRFSTPHVAGTATTGKSVNFLCYVEITNVAGDDPVGLATFSVQCGQTTCFGKTMTVAHGPWGGGTKYVGPLRAVRPRMIGVQSLAMNTDFIIRGLQQAVDIEIRIAYLNVFYTDETAYGPVANASAIFTAGRPVLYALPTTTPTSGPLAVGGSLAIGSTLATLLGGGLTKRYDAIRGGAIDVGDMTPATASLAAIPYTVQAGDAGSNLLLRTTGSNSWGGGSSAFVDSAALAVAA